MIVQNERKGLKFRWLNIYFKFKWHLKIKWFKLKNPRRSMFESYQSQHLFFCFVLFCFVLFCFILFLWILIFTKRMKWKRNIMYIRSFTLFFYSLLLYTLLFFSYLLCILLSCILFSLLYCDIKNALSRFRTCDPGVISTMLYRLSYESLTIYL